MLVKCKVCGAEYDFCPHCAEVQSWRRHTDTADHYYIWLALMTYQTNHDAKAAYAALRKRGIDTRIAAGYEPSIQALLSEINASVWSAGKAKKADIVAQSVDADGAESDNAEE